MRTCLNHPERKHHAKGLCSTCYRRLLRKPTKTLAKTKVSSKVQQLKDKEASKAKSKNSKYLSRYGITSEDVAQMRKKQRGRCAICNKVTKTLHVDHHHDTDTVRDLLCGTCNRGIGNLRECTTTLLNAVRYLLYWSTRYEGNRNV